MPNRFNITLRLLHVSSLCARVARQCAPPVKPAVATRFPYPVCELWRLLPVLQRTCTNHTNEIHTAALPHSYVVLSCGSNLRLEETGELQLQCLQNFGYATKSSLEVPVCYIKIKGERFVSRYIANAIYCIIWKYRDIAIFRKYRDILTIFSVHDNGQF